MSLGMLAYMYACVHLSRAHDKSMMMSCTGSRPSHASAYSKRVNRVRGGGVGGLFSIAFILYNSNITAGVTCLRRTLWERSVLSEESGACSVLYISSLGIFLALDLLHT